ncbi:MAG: FecR family protein [Deltaproteobacteria bacterium]|nr:FecR family protein [Deltaproteobacteria bacterium]
MKKKLIITFSVLFLFVANSYASNKYGDAEILRGTMKIVRQNGSFMVDASQKKVEILKNDLVRVGPQSMVTLETVEDTTIELGSNAIMHFSAWKSRNRTGYTRMLFGKAKYQFAAKGQQKRRYRVKTAMAVIGVKGTKWWQETTPDGNTLTMIEEGEVGVLGMSGGEQTVSQGQMSAVVNGSASSKSIVVPPKIKQEIQSTNLDSMPPTSLGASTMTGEVALVETGIVQQSDIIRSKGETITLEENFDKDQVKTTIEEKEIAVDPEIEGELIENLNIDEEIVEPDSTNLSITAVGSEADRMSKTESTQTVTESPIIEDTVVTDPIDVEVPQIDLQDALTGSQDNLGNIIMQFEK